MKLNKKIASSVMMSAMILGPVVSPLTKVQAAVDNPTTQVATNNNEVEGSVSGAAKDLGKSVKNSIRGIEDLQEKQQVYDDVTNLNLVERANGQQSKDDQLQKVAEQLDILQANLKQNKNNEIDPLTDKLKSEFEEYKIRKSLIKGAKNNLKYFENKKSNSIQQSKKIKDPRFGDNSLLVQKRTLNSRFISLSRDKFIVESDLSSATNDIDKERLQKKLNGLNTTLGDIEDQIKQNEKEIRKAKIDKEELNKDLDFYNSRLDFEQNLTNSLTKKNQEFLKSVFANNSDSLVNQIVEAQKEYAKKSNELNNAQKDLQALSENITSDRVSLIEELKSHGAKLDKDASLEEIKNAAQSIVSNAELELTKAKENLEAKQDSDKNLSEKLVDLINKQNNNQSEIPNNNTNNNKTPDDNNEVVDPIVPDTNTDEQESEDQTTTETPKTPNDTKNPSTSITPEKQTKDNLSTNTSYIGKHRATLPQTGEKGSFGLMMAGVILSLTSIFGFGKLNKKN